MTALHDEDEYFKPAVDGEHWATPYFKEAEEKGYLMYGTENDDWNIAITRREMAHILAKVCIKNSIFSYSPLNEKVVFLDEDEIDRASKSYIDYIVLNRYVNGYPDGSFGPNRTMTRAECATVIFRFLDTKDLMGKK